MTSSTRHRGPLIHKPAARSNASQPKREGGPVVSRSLDARTDAKSRVRVRPTFTRWPTHPTTITAAYSFGPATCPPVAGRITLAKKNIRSTIDAYSMQVDPTVKAERRRHDRG